MVRRALLPLLIALSMLALATPRTAAAGLAADIESGIAAQLRKAEGKRGKAACVVVDLAAGETLYESRGGESLAPASNMKLLVSAAALSLLGPEFEWVTRVMARGEVNGDAVEGDLCLVGGGDPNLSGRFHGGDTLALFKAWAAALKARGIARVNGDLLFETTLYGETAYNESWPRDDQYVKWYCAQVSALAFNDNCIGIKVTPQKAGRPAKIETIPSTAYVKIVNETTTVQGRKGAEIGIVRPRDGNTITVKGKVYEQATWGYSIDVTVHDPACYAATVFKETLESEGIRVAGSVKPVALSGREFRQAATLVEHRSRLVDALKPINTNSQNLHAEMLLRQLGVRLTGKGTFKTGTAALLHYLKQEGLSAEGLKLVDGSGLAADNRLTARAITGVLQGAAGAPWFEHYRDSLATGGQGTLKRRLNEAGLRGKLFAKTGYISGVRSLSGYLIGERRKLAFSILMTDCVYSRECQDEIVKLLSRA